MAVRAVVFDVGGVLEHTIDTNLEGRWEHRLGLEPGEFYERMRRSGLGRDANLGRISDAEFWRGMAKLYRLDQAMLDELTRDMWEWYVGELNTELASYFRRLRPRFRTAILSNGTEGGRREEEARYGFAEMADVLVYSYEEGMEKPDPRVYRLTCERLDVPSDETVFLDDVEANVVGARAVGMRAVLFEHTAQAIADVEECLTDTAG